MICPNCKTKAVKENDTFKCPSCNETWLTGDTSLKAGVEGQSCGNCLFWNLLQGSDGECRRNAPRKLYDQDKKVMASDFAVTKSAEWCGDWQVRIQRQAQLKSS